jgi:citrate lyase beta subunit
MAAKLPEIAPKTDILLGNLEDAIPADRKEAARSGLVQIGRESHWAVYWEARSCCVRTCRPLQPG